MTTSTTYLSNTPQTFSVPFIGDLSVTFRLGAANSLEEGAIVKGVTALHVAVEKILPASVSTQIAILRKLLLAEVDAEVREWFVKAAKVRSLREKLYTCSRGDFRERFHSLSEF